jgi:hypothetical protein
MSHLNVSLDDIGRVEIADGVDELLERLIVLLLLIQVVCVLLADFRNDFLGELSILGDLLGLSVQALFQQCLNLNVIFHLV